MDRSATLTNILFPLRSEQSEGSMNTVASNTRMMTDAESLHSYDNLRHKLMNCIYVDRSAILYNRESTRHTRFEVMLNRCFIFGFLLNC